MESQKKVKHQRGTDYHKGTKSLNNIGESSVLIFFIKIESWSIPTKSYICRFNFSN